MKKSSPSRQKRPIQKQPSAIRGNVLAAKKPRVKSIWQHVAGWSLMTGRAAVVLTGTAYVSQLAADAQVSDISAIQIAENIVDTWEMQPEGYSPQFVDALKIYQDRTRKITPTDTAYDFLKQVYRYEPGVMANWYIYLSNQLEHCPREKIELCPTEIKDAVRALFKTYQPSEKSMPWLEAAHARYTESVQNDESMASARLHWFDAAYTDGMRYTQLQTLSNKVAASFMDETFKPTEAELSFYDLPLGVLAAYDDYLARVLIRPDDLSSRDFDSLGHDMVHETKHHITSLLSGMLHGDPAERAYLEQNGILEMVIVLDFAKERLSLGLNGTGRWGDYDINPYESFADANASIEARIAGSQAKPVLPKP